MRAQVGVIRQRYRFSIATLEAPVPWMQIWYGLQSLLDIAYIPQGIRRQPHFLLPVLSWLNPGEPWSGRVNIAWCWASASNLVWGAGECVSVCASSCRHTTDTFTCCSEHPVEGCVLGLLRCVIRYCPRFTREWRFPICAKDEHILRGILCSGGNQTWQKGFEALLEFSNLVTGGTIRSFFMRSPVFRWL